MKDVNALIDPHRDRFLSELLTLLSFPSVSNDADRKDDVCRTASWLSSHLRGIGLQSEVMATAGHPVVFAQRLERADLPTVLVYGHYDVQPVDPLDEWLSPPFAPEIRDGKIFARGATDDKGQAFAHVAAIDALLRSEERLPVNIKLLIEGEEEIGSPSLHPFLTAHKDLLAADLVVVSDTSMFAADTPSLCYGLRGLVYCEVHVQGPTKDLHSGQFGGAVENPINALATIIAGLKDKDHRITIPGFYDDVRELPADERAALSHLPGTAEELRKQLGVPRLAGEAGYDENEWRWTRPTLDVNGIWGGFMGAGAKTVIPARAGAKISMRIVPNQDPEKIARLFEEHVVRLCPPTVRLTVLQAHSAPWALLPRDHPAMSAARTAVRIGFGKEPVLTLEGGSIPVVQAFEEVLGLRTLLIGFGLPDDGAHSPNEKLDLDHFYRGIATVAALYRELGGAGR